MSKFKVGDKVRMISEHNYNGSYNFGGVIGIAKVGSIYKISEVYDKGPAYRVVGSDLSKGPWHYMEDHFELVDSNKNNMNIKEKFVTAFLSEPEKTFRKAGVTNGDGFLTEDGQKIFFAWLLKKNGGDFKKEVVDELVKESQESEK